MVSSFCGFVVGRLGTCHKCIPLHKSIWHDFYIVDDEPKRMVIGYCLEYLDSQRLLSQKQKLFCQSLKTFLTVRTKGRNLPFQKKLSLNDYLLATAMAFI